MKFVHVGDLHIGRVIHQVSLLDEQRELLFELLTFMDEQDIRTLVIAGDVYDRLIPTQEAVNLLNDFLTTALLKYNIKVLMISGNHDSADRLNFASSILSSSGLFISSQLEEKMEYVDIEDVRFYLLPFVKPSAIKNIYEEAPTETYNDALHYYLNKQDMSKEHKNILVTHQFVGKSSQRSESELPLSVGGSEIIDATLFKGYDYVALGHLHAPQKVSKDYIRYSGSLMRYSFDEVTQNKSAVIVDTEDMSFSFYDLKPKRDLNRYTGSFKDFLEGSLVTQKDDYLSFELTDTVLIPHAMEQLRPLYPHLLKISYVMQKDKVIKNEERPIQNLEKRNSVELFEDFYDNVKNQELTDKQKKIVQDIFEKVGQYNED